MKARMLILLFLIGGTAAFAQTRVHVGIHIGEAYPAYGYYYAPPPPPPVVVYTPPCPGPGYYWVPGSYYYTGSYRRWRAGYWAPRFHPGRGWGHYKHDRDRWDRYDRDDRHSRYGYYR